jgi:hypothetical protein
MRTPNAAAQTRRDAIEQARLDALNDLVAHERFVAGLALAQGAVSSFNDFFKMRGAMLAGGLHRVRLTGGRGIDR